MKAAALSFCVSSPSRSQQKINSKTIFLGLFNWKHVAMEKLTADKRFALAPDKNSVVFPSLGFSTTPLPPHPKRTLSLSSSSKPFSCTPSLRPRSHSRLSLSLLSPPLSPLSLFSSLSLSDRWVGNEFRLRPSKTSGHRKPAPRAKKCPFFNLAKRRAQGYYCWDTRTGARARARTHLP